MLDPTRAVQLPAYDSARAKALIAGFPKLQSYTDYKTWDALAVEEWLAAQSALDQAVELAKTLAILKVEREKMLRSEPWIKRLLYRRQIPGRLAVEIKRCLKFFEQVTAIADQLDVYISLSPVDAQEQKRIIKEYRRKRSDQFIHPEQSGGMRSFY